MSIRGDARGRGESDEAGQVAAFPPNFVDCIVLDRL
ncbi:MAG: hypothetical protein ACI8RZ_007745, partial [Myxococcota bacterium]